MKKQLNQVKKFHKKFDIETKMKSPGIPESEYVIRRHKLIREEYLELQAEMMPSSEADIKKIAKEIADILYVVYGAIIDYGLDGKMEAIFKEVHKSNMSKSDKKDENGKVVKGKHYHPANLERILK